MTKMKTGKENLMQYATDRELPTPEWPTTLEKLMAVPTGGLIGLQTGEIISCRSITDCGNGFIHLHLPKICYPRHLAKDLFVEYDGLEIRRDAIVWIADQGVYLPECTE